MFWEQCVKLTMKLDGNCGVERREGDVVVG